MIISVIHFDFLITQIFPLRLNFSRALFLVPEISGYV